MRKKYPNKTDIRIRNRKEALVRQMVEFRSSCFKYFTKSSLKHIHRKANQLYNEQD